MSPNADEPPEGQPETVADAASLGNHERTAQGGSGRPRAGQPDEGEAGRMESGSDDAAAFAVLMHEQRCDGRCSTARVRRQLDPGAPAQAEWLVDPLGGRRN